jgi:hypothetical protein
MSSFSFDHKTIKPIVGFPLAVSICLIFTITVLAGSEDLRHAQPELLEVNETILDFPLNGIMCEDDRRYLGCGKKQVMCSDTDSKFLLLEVFSIYCTQCQRVAPKMKKLYKLIEADPLCRTNFKMIGIGAGNNEHEVKYFRKYYGVPFPLLPDPDYSIHKTLKQPRTPLLLVLKKEMKRLKVQAVLALFESQEEHFKQLREIIRLDNQLVFKDL